QAKVPSAVYEPPKGQYFRHVVRRGETLSRIASRYGVTVRSLRSWNRLSSKSVIRPGQRLRIWLANAPATQKTSSKVVRYTVRSGDTVFSIAKRYRVSISAIKRANRMKTFDIRPGQKLIIPR
ncbi:MAG TPA: N-acetylmuramoyl-L-alanine amidase AmiB, partial [Sutterella sp.]|nr:N-acetylmuramoyl-L-alanine amidase AmiB [Sutterella sp.]